ncbi:MAG: crotonase [Porticoccaceae bacterium]|nr:MAG: crotonase [Porticoccaceae bacterium]
MSLAEYQTRYRGICFERSAEGVLEMRLHTRGGQARWGTAPESLHGELPRAFADVADDPDNRVVILTGTGNTFIAERDPEEPAPEPDLAALWPRIIREGIALVERYLAIPVPVIAAVNGPALLHTELAVLADVVLAAEHAEFADLFHFPQGVVPGDGVHWVWPMLLGPNRARYFLLTGERIGAEEARRLGFVAEVLPAEQLLPRARELAKGLAQRPTQVLRHTRQLFTAPLKRRLREEQELGLALEALASLTR